MKDQIREDIVERVTESEKRVDIQKSEKVFYLPHRPVTCKSVESTKLKTVYDASAKASKSTVSLNECLETGSPPQNLLYNIIQKGLLVNLNQRT